jgi:EcsC protein family
MPGGARARSKQRQNESCPFDRGLYLRHSRGFGSDRQPGGRGFRGARHHAKVRTSCRRTNTEIGSQFGLVVSDKAAAGAIPLVGALGGAAANLAFMEHFQRLARTHFAIRRLEREYGQPEVVRMYTGYAPLVVERTAQRPESISR